MLVIDINGVVHAANPAAREMLGAGPEDRGDALMTPFVLAARPAWQDLADVAARSILSQQAASCDVSVPDLQGSPRRLHAKTYLTQVPGTRSDGGLCVMFVEDLREMEARVRTEKLAAMGRMSAAVAHEIRNPLSAIAQANALLSEEGTQPHQEKLIRLVAKNVKRLNRVVEDVLDVARAQGSGGPPATIHDASRYIKEICTDWADQNQVDDRLRITLDPAQCAVEFEPDHLRRVVVNLLDNALRYATSSPGAIRVAFGAAEQDLFLLSVWSDGPPIEVSVQRHLFEPFFSSQSRSSGLGLYICRELSVRHGALISYQRTVRSHIDAAGESTEGNDFQVLFRASPNEMQWASSLSPVSTL